MTNNNQKALALLNEVRRERGRPPLRTFERGFEEDEALTRAIEQHEAFRQEVSDDVELAVTRTKEIKGNSPYVVNHMRKYIIPKPVDPLVEAMQVFEEICDRMAPLLEREKHLRAALDALGLEIRSQNHD